MKRLLSFAPKLKYILYLDVWEGMCIKFICRISIMQGHISLSFSCENFKFLQVVSAGFPQCKNDVSASFSCGNYTYAKFPNRFCMLKLFGIAKFQQVSVDGNRLEFGTP